MSQRPLSIVLSALLGAITALAQTPTPPTVTTSFAASQLALNGTTSLSFTIANANASAQLTGIAFSDSLPAGLIISTPDDLTGSCGGGAIAFTDGSNSLSLSGATLAGGGSCTFSINVTAVGAGDQANTTGPISANESGAGTDSNTADVTVVAPPVVTTTFGLATIPLNGSTSLTFTVNNANTAVTLTGIGMTDMLPPGLVISTPNQLTGTCGGGTITANAADVNISLSGATLAAGGSCTFSLNVTGATAGVQSNTTGAISSNEGGTGLASNTASLTVVAPPSITETFGSAYLLLNGTTALSFTITNPNATQTLSGIGFNETLPSGLVIAANNGLTGTCGSNATITAAAGTTSITLTSGNLDISTSPNGSCTFTVNVTSTAVGVQNNNTGGVSSTEGGTGQAATASVAVVIPPAITKVFGTGRIPVNGTTTLAFTISNGNTVPLSGVGFTDPFPAGLVLANGNVTGSCSGGTITAVGGSSSVTLAGAGLAANSSCTFSVNVTGTSAGSLTNTTSAVTSVEAGAGNAASANLSVTAAPTVSNVFGVATIPLNGETTLTFTVNNPNSQGLTGIGFSDALPAGLQVASPNGLTNTCSGTVLASSGSISLSGANLNANTSCTFSVNVTGVTAGVQSNTTGAITANESGTGATSNTASILVVAPPNITETFGTAYLLLNGTTTLSFTITNPNATQTLSGIGFNETLPSGLVIAANNGLTGTCGSNATITATAGTTSITLTGGNLDISTSPNGSCTFTVSVTSTAIGVQNNNTGGVSSTEGGTGQAATASVAVVIPPAITKVFGIGEIPVNGTTTLSFTISNGNTVPLTGVGFTDPFPAGLVLTNSNVTGSCNAGTITARAGLSSVTLAGGTLTANSSCTFGVNVTGTSAGNLTNTTSAVASNEAGIGNAASANLSVTAAPTVSNLFGVPTIPLNGTTSLTFTVNNPNVQSLTGIAFNDTLPSGLQVASPNGLASTCSGTVTALGGTISLSGANLNANASCTFSVSVTGATAGVLSNTTGAITANESGAGATSNTASITVVAPPTITTTFGTAYLLLNGTTTLSFTITNPNATQTLSGIGFTDALPSGLVIATPNGLTGTCGSGTITATAAGTSVTLTGGNLGISTGPNASCTFSVNVTGSTIGVQNNSTGTVSSTEGGTGQAATASVTVVIPPAITKVFGTGAIPVNGSTSLTFTISNGNTVPLTGVGFTDLFPSGLVVATPNGLSATCGGGTITAISGSNTVSLTTATLAANSACTFSVNVRATLAGSLTNTTSAVTSNEAGIGNAATANLGVTSPPVVSLGFNNTTVPLNGTTALFFTVNNPNGQTLTGIAFSDVLPAGLTVASPNGLSGSCGGGAITASGSTIGLSGATMAANGFCTFSVNVTGITAGVQSTATGPISANQTGSGSVSNTATITVVVPPTITKTFGAATVALNASTSLTFTVTNPTANVIQLTGVGFTDTFPAGLAVATPNALTGSCGGGTITATAGTGSVALSGATLAANSSCIFSVNITGTATGAVNNTTGNVTSNEGGSGGTATASITVLLPPSISKSFGTSRIALNAGTTLSFTITNSNTVALTGVAFTDTFPAGIAVATPNGLTGGCGAGTITATAGTASASLSGATLTANSSCTFSVNVAGTSGGNFTNTTGAVTSTNGGSGSTASANLSVTWPPTITEAFGGPTVALNSSTSLTFTVKNQNTTQGLTGVGFTDTLPAGLIISTPNGLNSTCGGTLTAGAGSNSIALSGASLSGNTSCTISLNVNGTVAGNQNNTTGAVTSVEGGTGGTASASIAVVAPPTITKSFTAASIALNGSTALSFTVTNPAVNTVALTGIGFTDNFPAGLAVATPTGLTGSCGSGTIVANPAGTNVALSGASLAANASCTFSVNVNGTAIGTVNNTTGVVTSNEGGNGGTATASLTVLMPASISKSFGAAKIPVNGTTTLSFTVTNPAANAAGLAGVAFTDTFPSGIVVATPNGLSGSCGGGTITATAGANSVALAGATIATNGSCTFSVNVKGTSAGDLTNTTSAVTATNAGAGNTASANISVMLPPAITDAFGASSIPLNGTTTLSFTINNPSATQSLTGVAFSDALPSGLAVSTPNGLTGTCGGGTITAVAASSSVSLANATLAANASCTFSVSVTGTTAGPQANTTGAITSNEGGTGVTSNTATVTVVAPPTITKTFGASTIAANGTTTLSFSVTNPNASASLSGIAFSDALPSGLVVSTPNGLTGGCGGGTITATAGSATVSLASAALTGSSSCTFSVKVTATGTGAQNNTTGPVTSNEGGTGGTASASLAVLVPPSISKSFGASQVMLNASTTLTFTITNPATNTAALTGVAFTDTFPTGLIVATPNGLTGTCGGGTITATAASGSVSLSGATISASGSCTFSVNVKVTATGGTLTNTTGAVTSTNAGNGNTASATLGVDPPPTVNILFGASSIALNSSTSLTFNVANPNPMTITGVSFSDTLPSGLAVATPNGFSDSPNGCTGTIVGTAGSSTISLTGASLGANASCTFSFNVTGIAAGVQNDSIATISSNEAGSGPGGSATVTVIGPPVLTMTFGASGIPLNGTTSLTFMITNPDSISLSGIGFTDTLPSGLIVASPNAMSGSCGTGTIAATSGTNNISLTGGTLAANGSCTFSVNVTAIGTGVQNNTTSAVSWTQGDAGSPASASISVNMQLSFTMWFGAAAVPLNAPTSLNFTVTNTNATSSVSGVMFSDTVPSGLAITSATGFSNTCGGTVALSTTNGTISFTNGSIPAASSCTLSVNLTAIAMGLQTTTSSAIYSTQTGYGAPVAANTFVGNSLQTSYASNLIYGDSYFNLTNSGDSGGSICVNVYTFDPAEEMVACCACALKPNQLASLSAHTDLIANTLTAASPTSISVKFLTTTLPAGSTCDAATPTASNLSYGLQAWSATPHPQPSGSTNPYKMTEVRFGTSILSGPELTQVTGTCGFIEASGEGYGICKSCQAGGLGGSKN